LTRSSMLEVLRQDYIRTARAKGASDPTVNYEHALRNAMLPVVTSIRIEAAFLIGGLIVTETVFNIPGVARFLVEAILWRDYPIVQNLVMFIAIVVIVSNLVVDMLYGFLDPRVRYGHQAARGRGGAGEPRPAPAGGVDRARPLLPQEAAGRDRRRAHGGDVPHRGLRQP